jgi:hypothetical protein
MLRVSAVKSMYIFFKDAHTDPLTTMYHAESERSLPESVDEHVMEGGVTIRRQTDKKKPVRLSPHPWSFRSE